MNGTSTREMMMSKSQDQNVKRKHLSLCNQQYYNVSLKDCSMFCILMELKFDTNDNKITIIRKIADCSYSFKALIYIPLCVWRTHTHTDIYIYIYIYIYINIHAPKDDDDDDGDNGHVCALGRLNGPSDPDTRTHTHTHTQRERERERERERGGENHFFDKIFHLSRSPININQFSESQRKIR